MSIKKSPTIRKVAWISLLPQIGVMVVLFFFFNALGVENPVIAFSLTYVLLSVSLRTLIPKNHREGISLVGKKNMLLRFRSLKIVIVFLTNMIGLINIAMLQC